MYFFNVVFSRFKICVSFPLSKASKAICYQHDEISMEFFLLSARQLKQFVFQKTRRITPGHIPLVNILLLQPKFEIKSQKHVVIKITESWVQVAN
jgi:hypothetical protein